jgi:hypothetical protein
MASAFSRWAAVRVRRTVCVVGIFWCQLGMWSALAPAAVPVTINPSDVGAIILADGQPFAEYRKRSGFQPAIWPIIGPTDKEMTRSYPVGPLLEGESQDHPHHRSLWFAHGSVNGLDFWTEFENATRQQDAEHPVIAHRAFEKLEVDGDCAVLVAVNDWMHVKTKVCEDVRTLRFGADEKIRWIDFQIELKATAGDVVFGDTKEGTFGIRVPETMKVDAKLGGKIVNSNGQTNDKTWGQPATWVQYRGPVQGEDLGITIVNLPGSFRYPTRWHVRTYGLFAANPFGEREFPPAKSKQGEVTLPAGDSLRLRYLVLLHQGGLPPAAIRRYTDFIDAAE